MSAIPCPVCGALRKVEQISTPEGWVNPPCHACGDPGWTNPGLTGDPLEGRPKPPGPSLVEVVRHCIAEDDLYDRRQRAVLDRRRAEGWRIVYTDTETDCSVMHVRDHATEEVLWRGTAEEYDKGDWGERNWIDYDWATEGVPFASTPLEGVPSRLLEAISDAVDEGVREWAAKHA